MCRPPVALPPPAAGSAGEAVGAEARKGLLGLLSVGWCARRQQAAPLSGSSLRWYEADGDDNADGATARACAEADDETPPQIIADIRPGSKEAFDNPAVWWLMHRARTLSLEVFAEDICSRKGPWRLTFLARDPEAGHGAELLGFILWRVSEDQRSIVVSKLAVPEALRSRGYGRRLLEWVVEYARNHQDVRTVALYSLARAVRFYQRLGFQKCPAAPKGGEQDDILFPGQVYMQMSTAKGPGAVSDHLCGA